VQDLAILNAVDKNGMFTGPPTNWTTAELVALPYWTPGAEYTFLDGVRGRKDFWAPCRNDWERKYKLMTDRFTWESVQDLWPTQAAGSSYINGIIFDPLVREYAETFGKLNLASLNATTKMGNVLGHRKATVVEVVENTLKSPLKEGEFIWVCYEPEGAGNTTSTETLDIPSVEEERFSLHEEYVNQLFNQNELYPVMSWSESGTYQGASRLA
jgi:hypothetical protein